MSSAPVPQEPAPEASVHAFPTYETLSRAAAQHVVAHIETVLAARDRYTLAVAGGSTPRRLYELLSAVYRGDLPWSRVHLFWGDERWVPHDHAGSNARMVWDALVDRVEIPAANVHPMPVSGSPDAAADEYTSTLQTYFDTRDATFDSVLLGLGDDGHTASLFPENEPSPSDPRWVRAVTAPSDYDVRTRLTCTLPVLNGASQALFLVSGREKRDALSAVLDTRDASLPATHVHPRDQLTWFVDFEARPSLK